MQDKDSLVEKILQDLENALKKSQLCDFEIIISESKRNKSPVIVEDGHVGIESWCIKQIYKYIHQKLITNRSERFIQMDFIKYNRLLIGGIFLNSDCQTFWNIRKQLILDNSITDMNFELLINRLVLTNKPKCLEAFQYRKWLLDNYYFNKNNNNNIDLDQQQQQQLIRNEMKYVAQVAINKYKNNYHAYNYKLWLLTTSNKLLSSSHRCQLILDELIDSRDNLFKTISDYSAFHYRQQVLLQLNHYELSSSASSSAIYEEFLKYIRLFFNQFEIDHFKQPSSFMSNTFMSSSSSSSSIDCNNFINLLFMGLFNEFNVIEQLDALYPNHETVWYHRRFIISHLIKLISNLANPATLSSSSQQQTNSVVDEQHFTCQQEQDGGGPYKQKRKGNFIDCSTIKQLLVNNKTTTTLINCCSDDNNKKNIDHRLFDAIVKIERLFLSNEQFATATNNHHHHHHILIERRTHIERHLKWLALNLNVTIYPTPP